MLFLIPNSNKLDAFAKIESRRKKYSENPTGLIYL
jgi:hypothetical protein